MFPRYRFNSDSVPHAAPNPGPETTSGSEEAKGNGEKATVSSVTSANVGEVVMPPRTYLHQIALVHRFSDDKTTWFQYFRRPFYLFAFPNIVLAGVQFAFGNTAGIVSFNTISEIMTAPPYNWKSGPTGLIFLAALVGNFIG